MKFIVWGISFLVIMGCSNTQIFEHKEGKYTIVSLAEKESEAYRNAIEDSREYCQEKGKSLEVKKESSQYQGISKDAKVGLAAAKMVMVARGNRGLTSDGSTSEDYKVKVQFECR